MLLEKVLSRSDIYKDMTSTELSNWNQATKLANHSSGFNYFRPGGFAKGILIFRTTTDRYFWLFPYTFGCMKQLWSM